MAKQKAKTDTYKVRLEVRLDVDVADALRELAEDAGLSVNQVVNGIMRWAVSHAHQGEPDMDYELDGGVVHGSIEQPGCLWFGDIARSFDREDGSEGFWGGHVAFSLDFTDRRAVRDDWSGRTQ